MIRDIINTYREAFRQWVRANTRPKTAFEAEEKRLFWSKCYLFSVSSVIGIYIIHSFKERKNFGSNNGIPAALQLARDMNETEPIRVLKYVGFKRVSDETLGVKEILKDNNQILIKDNNQDGTSSPKVP